jgi:predicted RNA-binding protein
MTKAADKAYWLYIFNELTWQEFLNAGAKVVGFRESRCNIARKIKPKDYLLCYVSGVAQFIGVLEVQSEVFQDTIRIWKKDLYPCRLKVKEVVSLPLEAALFVDEMVDQFSFFKKLHNPAYWGSYVRWSGLRWKNEDGEIVLDALKQAKKELAGDPRNKRIT